MQYTVVINGRPEGPYSLEQLKQMTIQPGTFIRKPGMDDYKEAHEFAELRELFGFSYQRTAPQYFAAFDQRLMASAIDYFMLTFVYVLLVFVAYLFVENKVFRIGTLLLFVPIIPVAKFLYSSIAEASAKQATIGKRLMDIKVTDLMGTRISFGTSLARNLYKICSVLPAFMGYLYCFLNKKQQCLHDAMANTLVIKQRLL